MEPYTARKTIFYNSEHGMVRQEMTDATDGTSCVSRGLHKPNMTVFYSLNRDINSNPSIRLLE